MFIAVVPPIVPEVMALPETFPAVLMVGRYVSSGKVPITWSANLTLLASLVVVMVLQAWVPV